MSDATDDSGPGILFWVLVAGAAGVLLWQSQNIGDAVTAAVSGWQNVGQGPVWVPVINQAESAAGIPTNLLARMAYTESHFRPDIIDGTTPSSAGALGIMQLMPQYFSTVQVATPFTTQDTVDQITQAAQELARLYGVFSDWTLAVAAYNAGQGTVSNYIAGTGTLPAETEAYVAGVIADVPVPGALA
jgi:soluble lytic murein transglycosylase-like protein